MVNPTQSSSTQIPSVESLLSGTSLKRREKMGTMRLVTCIQDISLTSMSKLKRASGHVVAQKREKGNLVLKISTSSMNGLMRKPKSTSSTVL
jgi:hypothetical protein